MAQRLTVGPRVVAAPRVGRRWAMPAGLGVLAWRVLWAPFWVGSDVPAPQLPRWSAAPAASPDAFGLAGAQVGRTLDRLCRRVWGQRAAHLLVRAVWVALAVGAGWLALELAGGPAVELAAMWWVGGVLVALALVLGLLSRPSRGQVARMLDRSFGLQERVTTAVGNLGREVPRDGERASLVYLQVADAANAVASVRRHPAFVPRPPVRELVLAVAFGLLMAALYFLRGVGGDIPPVAAGSVPVFTPAVERPPEPEAAAPAADPGELANAPTSEDVRAVAERSIQAQRDLQALGRALDDHAVTRDAAEAIRRGDYDAAAARLREFAAAADQMSEAASAGLAGDLDQASSEMSSEGGQLADASQGAAAGLRQGEQAAQQGVRQLGDAVEETGGQVVPQQDLADQLRAAEAADAQRAQQGGQAGQQASGQQQAGQPGEPQAGQQGNPGEGADAEPGQPGDGAPGEATEGMPGENPGPGDGEQGGEGAQPGGQGQGTQGQEIDAQPGGEGARPGAGAQEEPGPGGTGEGDRAQQGGGAGTGDGEDIPDQGQAGNPGGGAGEEEGQGVPAEQEVGEGDGSGGGGDDPSGLADVTAAVELPRAEGGEGVQTGNDGGSASVGSGAGVMVGSGSAIQGEVGESGPDSNRVPAEHRSLVERYFSDGEAAE